jgi:CHAD domain-containing protein
VTAANTTTSKKLRATNVRTVYRLPRALSKLGYMAELVGESTSTDLYLDTDDWLILRSGAACRLRLSEEETLLSVQSLALPEGHALPTVHRESLKEQPAGFPASVPGTDVASVLKPAIGEEPVDVRLKLLREETVYRASRDDGTAIEVAAGAFHIDLGKLDKGFVEIELRIPRPARGEMNRISEAVESALGLDAAEGHILPTALDLAGLKTPKLEESEELALLKTDRLVDSAHRILRRHFAKMVWNEPGTRLGMDPEYLHDMRVASRRLRAAIRLLRRSLPQKRIQDFLQDLKWVGNALGRVRDMDVYIEHLEKDMKKISPEHRPALDAYVKEISSKREESRKGMLRALDGKRYRGFVESFGEWLEEGPAEEPAEPIASVPAVVGARELILRRLKRVLKDGRDITGASPDAQLHKLRIRCKRLRYACEFFADLYGAPASRFAKRVTKLQDILGAHQDAVVARQMVSQFAKEISGDDSATRDLYMAVGQLTAVYAQRAADERERFAKAWKRFDRRKVRKPLEERMKQAKERA